MRRNPHLCCGLLVTVLAGCVAAHATQPAGTTLPPVLATGTAIVAGKYTQAADVTAQPIDTLPAEQSPVGSMAWTPSPSDGIGAGDSGKSFEIGGTSRISIILDATQYPMTDLRVSNISPVPLPFDAVRYKGIQPGKRTIRNGEFKVIMEVVARP